MANDERRIRIELTPEQKKRIKELSGGDVNEIELTVRELEDRIAPLRIQ